MAAFAARGVDWIIETGGEGRPATGTAREAAGMRRLNDLSVRIEARGGNGPAQEFDYAPVDEPAKEGRTPMELAFPLVRRDGLRVQRRLWVENDGAARWTDLFINESDGEIVFEAVLSSEKRDGGSSFSPEAAPFEPAGVWSVSLSRAGESCLALVHRGAGPGRCAFFFDGGLRDRRAFQVRLAPGESAAILSFAVPASGPGAAAAAGRRLATDPSGHLAWMSPREKRGLRNFPPPEKADDAPEVNLVTPIAALCWGVTQVRVEAASVPAVVRMELDYWEDWDLPQGHVFYEHPLATDRTPGRGLRYDICWDVPNSPRHSGGFWKLEGTAWNAAGESASFLTGPFVISGSCGGTCLPATVVLAPAVITPELRGSSRMSTRAKYALLECAASNPDGVPVVEFVLSRRRGSAAFQVLRRIPAAALLAESQWVVDGPLSKTETFVYRLEAFDAAGESVGRSGDVIL